MRHCDLDTVTYRGPIIMIMAQWQPFPGCKQVGPLMRSAENFTVIGVAGSRGGGCHSYLHYGSRGLPVAVKEDVAVIRSCALEAVH